MKLKRIIPLTFLAVSLATIPSIVCSCGNPHQPDYTIRCDTTEITWSLSQTTETEKTTSLYTKDVIQLAGIGVNRNHFYAYLHNDYDDGKPLGMNITPNWYGYDEKKLSFTNLAKEVQIGNYWIQVTGLEYRDTLSVFSKNDLWFQFNVTE